MPRQPKKGASYMGFPGLQPQRAAPVRRAMSTPPLRKRPAPVTRPIEPLRGAAIAAIGGRPAPLPSQFGGRAAITPAAAVGPQQSFGGRAAIIPPAAAPGQFFGGRPAVRPDLGRVGGNMIGDVTGVPVRSPVSTGPLPPRIDEYERGF